MEHELDELRAEVTRLLAAALESDQRHAAELQKRDRNHTADTERLQHEHEDELDQLGELHELDVINLKKALESRDQIGQAKGIIMATMRCTADEAFNLLKRQSQAENRKVTEIAAELTSRAARRPGPVEPPKAVT